MGNPAPHPSIVLGRRLKELPKFGKALASGRVGRVFEPLAVMKFPAAPTALALLLVCVATLKAPLATAQVAPLDPRPADGPTARLATVREIGDADLPALSLPAFGAVSLRASLAGLTETPAASAALREWVGRGNVVFLHTDAAQAFGMQTVPARAGSAGAGGQFFGRARAALPFGSHPMLMGAGESGARRSDDPMRLPAVRTVFYTLREGDALVGASDVATPLLQVEDAGGEEDKPLYVAAIASFGAGWAIFCPDTLDAVRGDGAAFEASLRSFIPDGKGARWVGLPLRVLGADATVATVGAALQSRLAAAQISDGTAPLPALGTLPANVPAPIPTAGEPVLPLARSEAQTLLSLLNGPEAASLTALLVARVRWQLGQSANSARALEVAALDPNLARPVTFWSGCYAAQNGANWTLDAPTRATNFDLAARNFAAVGSVNLPIGGAADAGAALPNTDETLATTARNVFALPVSPLVCANWSRSFARLATVSALSPPASQFVGNANSGATVRFYAGDAGAAQVVSLLETAQKNGAFVPSAPHLEVLLFPSLDAFAGFRRALGTPADVQGGGAEVVGNHVLILSGAANAGGADVQTADVATVSRALALANLSAWTGGVRPLPAWIAAGVQGRAIELRPRAGATRLDADTLSAVLRGATPTSADTATALWNFVLTQYGVGAGEDLVARLAAGVPLADALEAATGDDEATFQDAFRRAG